MLRCAQQSLKTVIATAVAQNRQKAMSTASSRLDLEGIYPPIPTPFDDKEEIDYPALQRNIEKWSKIPFRGTVLYIYIYNQKMYGLAIAFTNSLIDKFIYSNN